MAGSHRTSFVDEQSLGAADILVCTPGRLMDHMRGTPGFTLTHLQMLIIDEADRLLSQSYQSWVRSILDGVKQVGHQGSITCPANKEVGTLDDAAPIVQTGFSIVLTNSDGGRTHDAAKTSSLFSGRLRKLLFSATLTTDPQHMASLELVNPRFISLEDSTPDFAAHVLLHGDETRISSQRNLLNIPHPKVISKRIKLFRTHTLRESVVLCSAQDKPKN